jgi:hypothetical protein
MMKEISNPLFEKTGLNNLLNHLRLRKKRKKAEKAIRKWERNGRPVPPPDIIKRNALKEYAEKYNLKVFVETGTLHGETVEAMKGFFEKIYSIELSAALYEKASERFKNDKQISIIQGDSGKKLGPLIQSLEQPALFWLDGHYSAGETARGDTDTPIFEELNHILGSSERRHVIIIDDARCFGIDPAYPNISALEKFILSKRNDVKISILNDSIRIVPV